MRAAWGFTLIELLIAIAAIALIAAMIWLSNEEVDQAQKTACLNSMADVVSFQAAWMATVPENPPSGDRILCSSYRTAAKAWNEQCDEHFDAFPIPECVSG